MTRWEYYPGALDEMLTSMKIVNPFRPQPYSLKLGLAAYRRLRAVLERKEEPGLPGSPGSVPRSMLVLTGLPLLTEESWPPNLWAVIDTEGRAIQSGVLNDLPEEGKDDA